MEILAAFAMGLAHGVEPDHLLVLSTLVARGAGAAQRALVGLRFGLGHVLVIAVAGGLALGLKIAIPPGFETGAEIAAGGALVLLGLVCLRGPWRALYVHAHPHRHGEVTHAHLHVHHTGEEHGHAHLTIALGGLFALGGLRSALLVGLPALGAGTPWRSAAAVLAFGAGIFASMSVAGLVLSRAMDLATRRAERIARWSPRVAAACAVALGLFWVLRSALA